MPIVTLCDIESARDNYCEPRYYNKYYNESVGSGWEFAGIRRKDPSGHYVTTRDGRTFYYTNDPYGDVEYSSNTITYTDGTIEKLSASGYLLSVQDKYNNIITYTYDSDDNLILISNNSGNSVTIDYFDEYIEVTKPDYNKIRLVISEITVYNVGNAYGFSETMPVNVISSIYDCTENKTIASFSYDAKEILYTAYTEKGIGIADYGAFVLMTACDSPYSGTQKIDYTELVLGKKPVSITSADRLSRRFVPEKYYLGNTDIPQITYTYEAKQSYLDTTYSKSDLPYYLKVSELTNDGKLTVTEENKSLVNIAGAFGTNQKIYDTNSGANVLLQEMYITYVTAGDRLHPENTISKKYNSSDNDMTITTEINYEYDSYNNLLATDTVTDGKSRNKITNTYYPAGRYYALKTSKTSNDDIVDISSVYTVNVYGDITNKKIYNGTSSDTLVKDVYYTYDENNNLSKMEVVSGDTVLSSEEYEYSENGVYLINYYSKDDEGNILLQESYDYDEIGNITGITNMNGTEQIEYDSLNRITKEIHPDGANKTIIYDETDRSVIVYDELSCDMRYFYNSMGLLQYIEEWYPASSSYDVYYDTMGNPNRVNDRSGNNTYLSYDIFGRQTEVLYPIISDTDEEVAKVKYYDVFLDDSNKCSVKIIISPTGKINCEYYDVYGRVYKTALVENYDDFAVSDFDEIISMPSNLVQVITNRYVYDNFDRVIERYDGENRQTTYTYDVFGNVLSTTTGLGDEALTVEYEYDSAGRCVKMIQGGDHITQYEYNEAGQLIKMIDPMGYTEMYTYDTAGNVLTQKDKNGIITTNTYDSCGRLVKTEKLSETIEYTYDAAGNILTSTDENGTIAYEYNADGTLSKKTYPDGKKITYESYDKNKNLLSMQDYFGNLTEYTYDAHGNISSIAETYAEQTDRKVTSYTYNSDNTLSKVSIPNSMTTSYTYDYAGRITYVNNNSPYMSPNTTHAYVYDNANNIIQATEKMYGHDTLVTTYTYDSVNRLATEEGSTKLNYRYDEYNNLISAIYDYDRSYVYDANNRLIQVNDWWEYGTTANGEEIDDWQTDFTYDNNGNLLSSSKNSAPNCYGYVGNQKNYTYDVWGRLTSYSDSLGDSAEYTYYPDGLRRSKT